MNRHLTAALTVVFSIIIGTLLGVYLYADNQCQTGNATLICPHSD